MIRLLAWRLRSHPVRLFTTLVAVTIAVGFIAGTMVLTDTISKTFATAFETDTAQGDLIVRRRAAFDTELGAQRTRLPGSTRHVVATVDGVRAVDGAVQGYAQIVDPDGIAIGDAALGQPTLGQAWRPTPALRAWRLTTGSPPRQDGEVVIDQATARDHQLGPGDVVTILLTGAPQRFAIVGVARFGSADTMAGATVALFDTATAQRVVGQPEEFDQLVVDAAEGADLEDLADRIMHATGPDVETLTTEELVAENETTLARSLDVFEGVLALFAAIALFVGSFLIHNTFSATVVQRRRELGLLRALGASRRQLLVSVLVEATIVGLAASMIGVVAGVAIAQGLERLLDLVGFSIPTGPPVVRARTAVIASGIGTAVTAAAAAIPARRAGRVPPLAAMSPIESDEAPPTASRSAAGAAMVIVGLAAACWAVLGPGPSLALVGIGWALAIIGVVQLAPAIAGPTARALGRPGTGIVLVAAGALLALPATAVLLSALIDQFWRGVLAGLVALVVAVALGAAGRSGRGVPGLLGRENMARHPRRASSTAAALMVGVALVTAFLVLASSLKASIEALVAATVVGDLVVTADGFIGGLPPDLADQIEALDSVGVAAGVQFNFARIGGESVALPGVDTTGLDAIIDLGVNEGSIESLARDEMAISESAAMDLGVRVGDQVEVQFATIGSSPFVVRAIFEHDDLAGNFLVDERAFDRAFADRFHNQIFIKLAPDAAPRLARQQIARVLIDHPAATLRSADQFRASQAVRVDQALGLVFGLLFLAIVLALLGIGNTLALAVLERVRELGVLRAIGMTPSQLRSSVRWEAVLIALFGTVVGLVIGVSFGWLTMRVLARDGFDIIEVPVVQLLATAATGAAVGVIAAVAPARRAGGLAVLDAIAHN